MTRAASQVGIILKRNPILLRQPNTFEMAYHSYREKLNVALTTPYNSAFFETQKGVGGKNDEPTEFQSRESPRQNDRRALDRHLDRTLYLAVRSDKGQSWEFPAGAINENEDLNEAATRNIKSNFGRNLDFWITGGLPVGHLKKGGSPTVFFMKSQLFAGQVEAEKLDFGWFTKEELAAEMDEEYYGSISDCLADR